jgi:spermidine synthase
VLSAFFVSGFASLVLETVWVRMMTLIFGGTTLAVVTVLTSFMGGIALGSYLAGKRAHTLVTPIRAYGILECSVALYALLLPVILGWMPHIYTVLPAGSPFLLTALIRFLLCSLLLLFPTTLMGATLPVLSHFLMQHKDELGTEVGKLYGINTFGAVAGALTGGFVLLPLVGHTRTLWVTSIALFALGAAMFVLGKQATQKTSSSSQETRTPHTKLQTGILWLIGITGAVAMVCQVLWTRVLSMVIGSSTYAFSLILGLFLIGLASGALWGARRLKHTPNPTKLWFIAHLVTAFAIVFGIWCMDLLPVLFTRLVYSIRNHVSPLPLFALKALVAGIPILLPTFFMGTFFPYALALYAQEDKHVGEQVGQVYAANTFGAIVGSALAGFVVIPLIGLQTGLAICAAIYILGAWALYSLRTGSIQPSVTTAFAVCCASLMLLPAWNLSWMSIGMYRISSHRFEGKNSVVAPGTILFYKEGMNATVSVHGDKKQRSLRINGKTDASSHGDWLTQVSIAALPLLTHPNAKDVALIGWGSGITAGAALQFPLTQLTALELEREVIRASRLFNPWNYQPEKDKRLRLLANDGRNFLMSTKRSFDVIISQPSNPWISGMANLFTKEYFELTKKKLRKDGIFCQWLQFYELSYHNIVMIMKTLQKVYPYIYIFEPEFADPDKIILASRQPLRFSFPKMQQMMGHPKVRRLLASVRIHRPRDLLPRYLVGGKQLQAFLHSKPATLNTDGHNSLEFSAPLDLVRTSTTTDASRLGMELRKRHHKSLAAFANQTHKTSAPQTAKDWIERAVSFLMFGHITQAHKALLKATSMKAEYKILSETFHRLIVLNKKDVAHSLATAHKTTVTTTIWKQYQAGYKALFSAKPGTCVPLFASITKEPKAMGALANSKLFWQTAAYCSFLGGRYGEAIQRLAKIKRSSRRSPK